MFKRLILMLAASAVVGLAFACSGSGSDSDDDANDAASEASQQQLCDELSVVRDDLEQVLQSTLSGDISAAEDSLQTAKAHAADARETAEDMPRNQAAAQSAADLAGAVDGLETTLRQVGQGGGSLEGVLQELQIQLPAIVTSFNTLVDDARCS